MKTLLAAVLLLAPIAARASAPDFDGIAQASADKTSLSLDERDFLAKGERDAARMRLMLAQLPAGSPAPAADAAAVVPAAPAPQPPVLVGSAPKLNLNLPLNTGAMLVRDGANGMWRAGGYIDPLGLNYGAVEYVEFGVAQSWTANKGYPGVGVHVGIPAGSLINVAQRAVTGYDLASLWKPLATVSNWVRLNGGYQHLQEPPGAGGKKDIWYAGLDVNVPVSVVEGWLQGGL